MKPKAFLDSIIFVLVAALGIFFFYWAVRATWIFPFHYDDAPNIILNHAIRYLDHPRVFIESMHQPMRPVTNLSFALDYFRSGLSVGGFRGTNFFLHAANIVLFAFLAWRIFSAQRLSFIFATLLFAVHPLVAESTVYISGRSILLATFFSLLCVHIFLFRTERRTFFVLQFFGFLLAAALAFFSKESAAMLALVILALLYWKYASFRKILLWGTPIISFAVVFIIKKWNFIDAAWAGFFRFQGDVSIYGFWSFIRFQFSLWPRMLGFFFNPHTFAIDHEVQNPSSWFQPMVLGGIALFFLLPMLAFLFRKRLPALSLGLWWMFFALLPTNSLFPVLDPLAERHLYLVLPGFALAAGSFFLLPKKNSTLFIGVLLSSALLISAFFSLEERALVWKSTASIWGNAYEKYPQKFRIVFNTALGTRQALDYEKAFKILTNFLQQRPFDSLTFIEREGLLRQMAFTALIVAKENLGEAEKKMRQNLSANAQAQLWQELVVVQLYKMRGTLAQVQARLGKAKKIAPQDSFYQNQLAVLLADLYGTKKEWQKVVAILEPLFPNLGPSPWWPTRSLLAEAYNALGKKKQALQTYIAVSNQWKMYNVYSSEFLLPIAHLYEEEGDYSRAADAYGELLRVSPDETEYRRSLVQALKKVDTSRTKSDAIRQERQLQYYQGARQKLSAEKELVRP